eukprot:TRINITY_DN5772_c0_g1_i3.p1 TRINITY_DN5772_c0_g1~~TRINITY_DN5772_c0_g1_i3.p1  ORF type:complete len:1230 (+),score=231.57 TRINITY_DN5772_c0_g1_i3:517-3690(+)
MDLVAQVDEWLAPQTTSTATTIPSATAHPQTAAILHTPISFSSLPPPLLPTFATHTPQHTRQYYAPHTTIPHTPFENQRPPQPADTPGFTTAPHITYPFATTVPLFPTSYDSSFRSPMLSLSSSSFVTSSASTSASTTPPSAQSSPPLTCASSGDCGGVDAATLVTYHIPAAVANLYQDKYAHQQHPHHQLQQTHQDLPTLQPPLIFPPSHQRQQLQQQQAQSQPQAVNSAATVEYYNSMCSDQHALRRGLKRPYDPTTIIPHIAKLPRSASSADTEEGSNKPRDMIHPFATGSDGNDGGNAAWLYDSSLMISTVWDQYLSTFSEMLFYISPLPSAAMDRDVVREILFRGDAYASVEDECVTLNAYVALFLGARQVGDVAIATEFMQRARDSAGKLFDQSNYDVAEALNALAFAAMGDGDMEKSAYYLTQSNTICKCLGAYNSNAYHRILWWRTQMPDTSPDQMHDMIGEFHKIQALPKFQSVRTPVASVSQRAMEFLEQTGRKFLIIIALLAMDAKGQMILFPEEQHRSSREINQRVLSIVKELDDHLETASAENFPGALSGFIRLFITQVLNASRAEACWRLGLRARALDWVDEFLENTTSAHWTYGLTIGMTPFMSFISDILLYSGECAKAQRLLNSLDHVGRFNAAMVYWKETLSAKLRSVRSGNTYGTPFNEAFNPSPPVWMSSNAAAAELITAEVNARIDTLFSAIGLPTISSPDMSTATHIGALEPPEKYAQSFTKLPQPVSQPPSTIPSTTITAISGSAPSGSATNSNTSQASLTRQKETNSVPPAQPSLRRVPPSLGSPPMVVSVEEDEEGQQQKQPQLQQQQHTIVTTSTLPIPLVTKAYSASHISLLDPVSVNTTTRSSSYDNTLAAPSNSFRKVLPSPAAKRSPPRRAGSYIHHTEASRQRAKAGTTKKTPMAKAASSGTLATTTTTITSTDTPSGGSSSSDTSSGETKQFHWYRWENSAKRGIGGFNKERTAPNRRGNPPPPLALPPILPALPLSTITTTPPSLPLLPTRKQNVNQRPTHTRPRSASTDGPSSPVIPPLDPKKS